MAEGLLRAKAGDRYEAMSAGTEPARLVHPLAIKVMHEAGIDISCQRPKGVMGDLGRLPVNHLIIVCDGANQRCPSDFPGVVTRDFWAIDDPAAFQGADDEVMQRFREARDDISSRLNGWLRNKAAR